MNLNSFLIMQRIIVYVFLTVFLFSISSFQVMAQGDLIPSGTVTITGQNSSSVGVFNGTIDGQNISIPSIIFDGTAIGTFIFKNINTNELIIRAGADVIIELTGGNEKNTILKIENDGTLFLKGNTFLPAMDDQDVTNNAFLTDSTASIRLVDGPAAITTALLKDAEAFHSEMPILEGIAISESPNLTFIWQRKEGPWWYDLDTIPFTDQANRFFFCNYNAERDGIYRFRAVVEQGGAMTNIMSNPARMERFHDVTLPEVAGVITDPAAGIFETRDGEKFRFWLSLEPNYSESEPIVTTSLGDTLEVDLGNGYYTIQAVTDSIRIQIDSVKPNDTVSNITIEDEGLRMYSVSGSLVIESPVAAQVRIYSFDGILQKNRHVPAGYATISMPAGLYIVQVNQKTYKISVRR